MITFPKDVSDDFRDFIFAILQSDPTKRLGNLKEGAFGIKSHPLFKRVTWQNLLKQKIKAPFIPKLDFSGDTRNFPAYKKIAPLKTADVDKYIKEFDMYPR